MLDGRAEGGAALVEACETGGCEVGAVDRFGRGLLPEQAVVTANTAKATNNAGLCIALMMPETAAGYTSVVDNR